MRFRWSSKNSERAVVTMTVARIRCKGMENEKALQETLHNGEHCRHPELISERQLRHLRKEIEDKLRDLEKGRTRREGKRPAG